MRLWPRRKVYIDDLPKTHDLRFGLIFGVGLVLVFGALYGVGYAVAGNKLPAGTTVAEVDVGGMSPDEARTVLQEQLAPQLQRPIKATLGGKTYSLDPQRAGLTFDIDATLDAALGGSAWDPRHMMHVLTGGDELPPVVDLDDAELADKLKRVADGVERKPADSTVSFKTGKAEVTYGHAGRILDYQRCGDRLVEALVSGGDEVSLAIEDVQPRITTLKATKFADSVGRRALRAPIRIKVADSSITLKPREFGPALVARPRHRDLRLDVDQDKLAERARDSLRQLPHRPVDARIRFRGDRPVVVPATSGVTVAVDDLSDAVLRAATKKGAKRVARADATPDNPRLSTQDVRMLQIRERIAAATQRLKVSDLSSDPRTGLRRLDGALIRPDQSFSFLRRVATGRSPADSFVASMTYGAGFHAGLDIPEHTPARIYSGTFAPARDAHIEPPATDLVLHNTSPYGVYVRAYVETNGRGGSASRVAHVEMWSTKFWTVKARTSGRYNDTKPEVVKNSRRSCVPREGRAGFDVDVIRVLVRDGHKRSERTHASYASLDEVRCSR